MLLPPRRYRRLTLIASILGLIALYHFFSTQSRYPSSSTARHHDPHPRPECPPLPGMEDVLVVMKTGVTEALDKVPVHFQTSFRCVPNYVVFSDFEEDIGGVRVRDALRNMDSEVKRTIPDFGIYNRIQKMGRAGLGGDDFADEANSAIGKPNNPGWKLDKWKFLPMVQETLRYKDDAKWYVFMEADTYFFWPNLLAWLQKFDPKKPLYIGTETQIADVIFAHGGSGFIVSNPAMQLASNEYATRTIELNDYTDHHWAGDCVLGKVLSDVGVGLHYSWPLLQNSNLGELDEFITDLYRKPWCFPVIALHHLTNEDIKDLWQFERQRWLYVRPPSSPSTNPYTNHRTARQNPPPPRRPLQRAHLPRTPGPPQQLGQLIRRRRTSHRHFLRRLPRPLREPLGVRAVCRQGREMLHGQGAATWRSQSGSSVWLDDGADSEDGRCGAGLLEAGFWLALCSCLVLLYWVCLEVWNMQVGICCVVVMMLLGMGRRSDYFLCCSVYIYIYCLG